MDSRLLEVSECAQKIIDATADLPPQYVAKIEELCSTLVSATAMAIGVGIKFVDASELAPGVTNIGDGVQAILSDSGELSFKKI